MSLIRTAKEFTRHFRHRLGFARNVPYLGGSRAENFATIYKQGVWQLGDSNVPLSGNGSSLEATAALRTELANVLESLHSKIVLDVGCGDFTWMQHIEMKADYIGIDIVPSVIEQNKARFGNSKRRFQELDAVAHIPPAADAAICREVLFHLSLDDATTLLRNLLAMGCKHFLLTNDTTTNFNADIESGDFRLLNLHKAPFKLGPPMASIADAAVSPGRFFGIWNSDQIAMAVGTK